MELYSLLQWAYPAIVKNGNSKTERNDLNLIVKVTGDLLRSGREEGFFLTVRYLHDHYDHLLSSSRCLPTAKQTEQILPSLDTLDGLLQNDIKSDHDLLTSKSIQLDEINRYRERLRQDIANQLPAVLALIFTSLEEYKKVVVLNFHAKAARLLYVYSLLASRNNHSLVIDSRISCIIQAINPEQAIQGIEADSPANTSIRAVTMARSMLIRKQQGLTSNKVSLPA